MYIQVYQESPTKVTVVTTHCEASYMRNAFCPRKLGGSPIDIIDAALEGLMQCRYVDDCTVLHRGVGVDTQLSFGAPCKCFVYTTLPIVFGILFDLCGHC